MKNKLLVFLIIIFLLLFFLPVFFSDFFYTFSQGCPEGCSSTTSGVCPPGQKVNCESTLCCCPDASYCLRATPYLTPPPGGWYGDICRGDPTCKECMYKTGTLEPTGNTFTALGCIPAKNPTQFVGWILRFAVGIGGGISFLLIIFGAIKVLTSGGNPENIKAGQEMITSALTGLIFIIFSLFLLQLIGVKILNIPGFGTP